MASPVQVAPPVRPRRSLAGPLVLIVLGVVFLLGTLGVLQWYILGKVWAHYWPVLIILWGVVKLLEYHQAQRDGTRPPGIGAGQVFLLIVLIFFGLAATQASRFNWGEIRDQINIDDGDFPLFGHTYSYDDQLQQEFPAGGNLHVVNDRGAVNVTASTDNQIRVVIHKRISADKQEDADKWNLSTKPQITVSGQTVSLNANTQSAGDHWVTTDMDVSLPRKASVVISTRRGDVSVLGRDGEANISSNHGDVSLADINGKVSLDLDHSSARVSQIAGDVAVEGHANDVSLQDIKGGVRLNGEFMESVKLSKIAKTVSFKSSRTDLEFSSLDGDLDLDSGDLRASNLTGPLRLNTRSKDIRLDGVSGDVRLQDENGAVELRLNKLGNVQVENRRGDIQIYVPDKAGFQLDARAHNGEIQSDFNELKVEDAHDQATAIGTVGGGGPRLVVTNEHGTIEIRKGSSAAVITTTPPSPPSPKEPRGAKSKAPPEPTEN